MAAITDSSPAASGGDERFFLGGAIAMTAIVVAGFSTQLAMGRSSFVAPPLVHAHATVFMGWVVIYLSQNILIATGRTTLHRRLGWIAAAWMVPMLGLGLAVTLAMVRRGQVPYFFRPVEFLILDPLSLLAFIGLTAAAIGLRGRTDWHRRLHFCAMAVLLGPAFGRLLPMPLLAPWAFEATVAACALLPIVGAISDQRRTGRVHPAWAVGLAVLVGYGLLTEMLTHSPLGAAIYEVATAGTPGAAIPSLDFPPPPPAP